VFPNLTSHPSYEAQKESEQIYQYHRCNGYRNSESKTLFTVVTIRFQKVVIIGTKNRKNREKYDQCY
jgi:hypothetical protein